MGVLRQKKIWVTLLVICLTGAFFSYYILKNSQNSKADAPENEPGIIERVLSKKPSPTPSETLTPTPTNNRFSRPTPTATPLPTSNTSTSNSSGTSSSSSSSTTPVPDPCDSITSSSYDSMVLADNPVLFFPFSESLAYCDKSGNRYNGVLHKIEGNTTLPNGDNALVFDGATSYIQAADNDKLSPSTTGRFTIEAWMRPDTLQFVNDESTGYVNWMGKGETGQFEYLMRMYSLVNDESRPNRISGYAFNLAGGLGVGSYFQDSLTAGQWIHTVLIINTADTDGTYPMGYTKIYKNGAQRDQDDLSPLSIVPENGTAPLRIGTRDFASFFEGAIGKIAVYDYELSAFQVRDHYQKMIPVTPGSAAFVKHIGSTSSKTAGTTLQIPVTSTVSAGNTLIVRVVTDYTAGAPSVTDSKGNTYNTDRTGRDSSNNIRLSVFSTPVTTPLQSGDTITITTASVAARTAAVDEFSGLLTANYLDQNNGTSGTNTTPGSTISITTTEEDELIIGAVGVEGPTGDTYNEDDLGQFTTLTRTGTNGDAEESNVTLNGGYKSIYDISNYQYKPTISPARTWVAFILSYKAD